MPGVVLIAGIWIQVRRAAERKQAGAAAAAADIAEPEPAYESANMPGGDPSSGGPE